MGLRGCFKAQWPPSRQVRRGGVAQRSPTARWSGLFLGLDLDDEVNVVSDRTQIGLHAEIRAFESAAGGKTSRVYLVERVLTDFVYDNVERNRFGHAMQGELSGNRPGVIVLFYKFGTDKRHLGKLGDVEPIGAFKILVARRKLCLQAVSLDGHVQV